MQFGEALVTVFAVATWVLTILDVLAADDLLTRRVAKPVWVNLVLFLPLVGGTAWLLLGRPERATRCAGPGFRTRRRTIDTAEFSQFVAGLQRATQQGWAEPNPRMKGPSGVLELRDETGAEMSGGARTAP